MPKQNLPNFPIPLENWHKIAARLQLSPRQVEVAQLILCNRCDKQIAAETHIEVCTVRSHISGIFRRTKVADRIELVLYITALSHGIERQPHDVNTLRFTPHHQR